MIRSKEKWEELFHKEVELMKVSSLEVLKNNLSLCEKHIAHCNECLQLIDLDLREGNKKFKGRLINSKNEMEMIKEIVLNLKNEIIKIMSNKKKVN